RGAHRGEHGTHPLFDIGLDDDEAERRVVAAIDRFLGHPPRLRVAAGTVLLQQGSDVGGIYLVLDGEVALRRHAGGVEDTQESAGPIVGLLSLATRRRASFEVVAVTEVRAVPLTLSQLEAVFTAEPEVASLLTRTLLAVLGDRLRGAHELRAQLVDAQDALVSQARLATLGELAAGLAHELSNPAAALERAVDHLGDDLAVLLADEPDVVAALAAARAAPPVPASTQRAVRRALAEATGDRARAEVVAEAAGWDPERAESLLDLPAAEVARLAAVHRLGVNLRNANVSAERVAALVSSLRAYLRGGSEGPMSAAVAVGGTLDDALRILGHRLEDLTVQRRDEPVPTVVAQPGQLQQVWTNLLANAVDAAGPGGRIEIVLDAPDPAHVRVRVTDDGPGIAPTDRDRVFAPRFTTKGGRVAYGLGLGLSVVERVVAAHGGTVAVTGAPGRTTFAVVLPVVPPDADPEER
ncbi:MAG: cyclic nucleotide-binding domain-containing protein, partial [Acidimicrobiales bacterium]|nr:cyclic nucleotide-binding domain-containing protein [Acidimicrobiales bacterium]